MQAEQQVWDDACRAAQAFAVLRATQPVGILVKGQAGPVRARWLAMVERLLGMAELHRLPTNISPDRLAGGLDLEATLARGRTVIRKGLLAQADGGVVLMPMAETAARATITQVVQALDDGFVRVERDGISTRHAARFGLIVFDESEPDDEGVPDALRDRLTLHIDLSDVSVRVAVDDGAMPATTIAGVTIGDDRMAEICALPLSFGLGSLRCTLHLADTAKALAALERRAEVGAEDVATALRVSLLNRARVLPSQMEEQPEPEAAPPEPEPSRENDSANDDDESDESAGGAERTGSDVPDDMLLDAVLANLPAGLLQQMSAMADLAASRAKAGAAKGRAGTLRKAPNRGRPLPSMRGELRDGARLDLVATLRAAAPWQTLRRETGNTRAVQVRAADFRIRRFQQKSGSSSIFVVDASGSTALNRLAEAKGAVEILLGESYARRDHVALVSFRGRAAEVLLPPTRSLVRAKRSLAALPGGGGTPLASGLQQAAMLAHEEQRRGRTPSIILMTDGSANVGLDGTGGRAKAAEDAAQMARLVRETGARVLLIDVGRQPTERSETLARTMGAIYVPMPFASAATLSTAVRAA